MTGSNEMHSRSRETTRAMACLADWILIDPSNPAREGDGPLRSCFASRQPDWIVPAGYIADAVASASDITGGIENFFGGQSATWDCPGSAAPREPTMATGSPSLSERTKRVISAVCWI